MILITVGSEKFPFDRLMGWVSVLIQRGFLDSSEVVVQYGACKKLPPGVRVYQFLKEPQFQELMERADMVIGHCGEGTLLLLERLDKPYILVPRSQQFGEHVDDHQVELALELAQLGAPIAWSLGDLARFVYAPYCTRLSSLSQEVAALVSQELLMQFA